jgi:predicted enzyme related to lactoylglutathione lyase
LRRPASLIPLECRLRAKVRQGTDHTIVHFEIPSDDPERAAKLYRELFGWTINKFEGTAAGGIEYWMVQTDPPMRAGCPSGPA